MIAKYQWRDEKLMSKLETDSRFTTTKVGGMDVIFKRDLMPVSEPLRQKVLDW